VSMTAAGEAAYLNLDSSEEESLLWG
jgi:hypothetical protein